MSDISDNGDTVLTKDLRFSALVNNTKKELFITTKFKTDFTKASSTDDLRYSINYATVCQDFKDFEALNETKSFKSISSLGLSLLSKAAFKQVCSSITMTLKCKEPKFDTHVELNRKLDNWGNIVPTEIDKIYLKNISLNTIIGLYTFERFQKQPIVLDIRIDVDFSKTDPDIAGVGKSIYKYVEKSNFKTVEALVLNVNKLIYKLLPDASDCEVCVLKTDIIEYSDVGVSTRKTREEIMKLDFELVEFDENDLTTEKFVIPNLNRETQIDLEVEDHIAFLAFGSNEGHQLNNIMKAIAELNAHPKIKVLQTSSLYKSKPMYYLNQPDFINGCLKITTTLTPHALLKVLKQIEYGTLNRVKKFNNGPRTIDLDIILYDSAIINSPDLNIPHIRMIERSFVLVPLCELLPPDFVHPVTAECVHDHMKQLLLSAPPPSEIQESSDLISLVPLPTRSTDNATFRYLEYDLVHRKTPTQLMAILNVTPDSFSDGEEENLNLNRTMEKVDEMVANKIDIIDIGGCSTRPGSVQPPVEEELNRVLPVVRAVKEKYGDRITVSIDTYRAKVAEESIKLGADMINDISAGSFDKSMYDVIAKYNVPYIINHTRGDISTMASLTNYQQTEDGEGIKIFNERRNQEDVITTEVSKELAKSLSEMYARGIRRWQIILDPGLGFAKSLHENLILIRHLPFFSKYKQFNNETEEFISFDYLPILLGPSRKKFIGTITSKGTAAERINGTSASITAGIGFGSDIVRVHDFKEMKDVCLMGDAIYKNILPKKKTD